MTDDRWTKPITFLGGGGGGGEGIKLIPIVHCQDDIMKDYVLLPLFNQILYR